MKLKKKRNKPLRINDITIIDDSKLKKAITAAALGNAMEWFDFGVYGFLAYVLGHCLLYTSDAADECVNV